MSDRYLTLAEVAKMLSVSRATVWRWRNERGLKMVRVGSITRIKESDLLGFILAHETGGNLAGEARGVRPAGAEGA